MRARLWRQLVAKDGMTQLWKKISDALAQEIGTEEHLTWIAPLHHRSKGGVLHLYAPNQVVGNRLQRSFAERITAIAKHLDLSVSGVEIHVGSMELDKPATAQSSGGNGVHISPESPMLESRVDSRYRFDNFVEGSSNRVARAACLQVAGRQAFYNPLVLYGDTGLGKTHLMHAVGNQILQDRPTARVLYVRSEDFFNGMVRALQQSKMEQFKQAYRTLDALLIDDVQFFSGKDRTQEEFFHTFNALYDAKQQIILTCDRYPKELDGLEQRLKSRFGWGLSVGVDPPDFETRTAILLTKAAQLRLDLSIECAQVIAKRLRANTNVRELEGALYTLTARANLLGSTIDVDFLMEALRDQFSVADRQISVVNIQKACAEFYRLQLSELLSKKRTRPVARGRQIAMALCKELTTLSLKDIGNVFGGRDHTTVLHACRLVDEWRRTDGSFLEEWETLRRKLGV